MGTRVAQVAAVIAAVVAVGACGADSQDQGLADSAAGTTTPIEDREASTTEASTSTTARASTSNPPLTSTTTATTTSSTSSPPTSTSTSSTQPPVDRPGVGAGPIDSGLQLIIDDAARQLADSESTSLSEITVESARTVSWNDGSIGCPEPSGVYTQALVEGSAVELSLRGSTYWFHAGANRQPFLCTSPDRRPVG